MAFLFIFLFIFFIIVKTVVVPDNYCGTCASTVAPECLNLCLSECHIKHNCLFKVKKFMGKFVVKIITHCIPIMESCLGVRFNVSWFFWEDSVMLQPYTYHCMKIVGRWPRYIDKQYFTFLFSPRLVCSPHTIYQEYYTFVEAYFWCMDSINYFLAKMKSKLDAITNKRAK